MIKPGDKIHIYHMSGEGTRYDNVEGTVTLIDDIGQVHGTWGGCALIPEDDEFCIIEED